MDNLDENITLPIDKTKDKYGKILKIVLGIIVLVLFLEGIFYFYLTKQRSKSQATVPPEEKNLLVDLGVDHSSGEYTGEDGIISVWLSGLVISSPYLKDNFYYLPLSFKEKEIWSDGEFLLGGEEEEIGSFITADDTGKVKGERTLRVRLVREIIPFLQPKVSVKVQIPVGFDQDKIGALKSSSDCDENCLKRITFLESYLQGNKEHLQSLEKEKSNEGGKIIGPIIQIEIMGELLQK